MFAQIAKENPKRITVARFSNHICFSDCKNIENAKPIRIGSRNPTSLPYCDFIPISTDGVVILHNGEKKPARDWLIGYAKNPKGRLIVLTTSEYNSLIDLMVDADCHITVLEISFPIFRVNRSSSLETNIKTLEIMIARLKTLGIGGRSLGDSLSNEFLFRIERKLQFKNGYDRYFSFAPNTPYQEVFKLRDERKDRAIVALDFNSMYASCMNGKFLNPGTVRYVDYGETNPPISELPPGLYRVILRQPTNNFIKEFHPFKTITQFKKYHFKLESSYEIETLLFKNEIDVYALHFAETVVCEGLISTKTIDHPLSSYALRTYRDRQHYAKQSNHIMEQLCKFKLATMHSATNKKFYLARHFKTSQTLIAWVARHGITRFPSKLPLTEKIETALHAGVLTVRERASGFIAKMLRFDANENVFSIHAQIVANARLKMLQTIERFLAYPSVEICYCNVDSIHLSVDRSKLGNFFESHSDLIGNRIGQLKIQAVADSGFWFDIGRYWLMKNERTVLFRNRVFNVDSQRNPFIAFKKVKTIKTTQTYRYVKTFFFTISNSFSYSKKILLNDHSETTDFVRYSYSEIDNIAIARKSIDGETLRSKVIKINLFKKISNRAGL